MHRGCISIALSLLLWEVLARIVDAPALFPPLTHVVGQLTDPAFLTVLLVNYSKTAFRSLLGFTIGFALGISTGLAISLKRTLVDYMSPLATLLFSIPSVVWVPVLMVLVGINEYTLPLMASVLCSYPPILYGSVNAFRLFESDIWDISRVYCRRWLTRYKLVVLPLLFARLLPSIRVEAVMVWKTVFMVEMLVLPNGLGYLALLYSSTIKMANLIAIVLVMLTTVVAINAVLDALERKFARVMGSERLV